MSRQLDTTLFNMKFTAKTLQKESAKCLKKQKERETLCLKAMKEDKVEMAKIYATDAIREKNQAVNFMRLSSRIDAVSARVEMAIRMNQVSRSMAQVTQGMESVLGSMDVEKISAMMEKFETQFDNLDVRAAVMEGAMASSTASATPEDEVQSFMAQVAKQNDMEFADALASAKPGTVTSFASLGAPAAAAPARVAVDAAGAGPRPPAGPPPGAGGDAGGGAPAAGAGGGGGGGNLDSLMARFQNLRG